MKRIFTAILFDLSCIFFLVAGLGILFSIKSPSSSSAFSNIVNNLHGFGASLLNAVPILQGLPPVLGLFFIILGVILGFISLRILRGKANVKEMGKTMNEDFTNVLEIQKNY